LGRRWKKYRLSVFYGLIFFLMYLISTAYRNPLELFGVRPMLFIPALASVAVAEDERTAAILGAFSGLMLDTTGALFFGFYTLQMTFIPYFIAILCSFVLRKTRLTALFVSFLWMLLFELIYYAVSFMSGAGDILYAFTHTIAPRLVYSTLLSLLFYPLFLRMKKRFAYQKQV